jgi:HAMP domain-containing protein
MGEQRPPSRTWYISLRWRLLIGFTLLFMLVFAGAYYWFYTFATGQALQRIQEDLIDTVRGAAAGVNGDELLSLSRDGQPNAAGTAWREAEDAADEEAPDAATKEEYARTHYPTGDFSDDPRYLRLMEWLETVHSIEPRAWPYLYVQGAQEKEIVWVVDIWARYDPPRAGKFLKPFASKKGFLYAGLSRQTLRTDSSGNFTTYTDDYGNWVSAYMPVQNAQGQPAGAIGVDFRAEYVDQVRAGILNNVILAFAITYIVLFGLVFAVSETLTRPIIRLTRIAERIGEGDYEQGQELARLTRGRFPNEIGTLASVFHIMVDKVREREQTLRRQVEELRFVIDETKRQKQVGEIVESNFFQELQARARAMRQRSAMGEETPDQPSPPEE